MIKYVKLEDVLDIIDTIEKRDYHQSYSFDFSMLHDQVVDMIEKLEQSFIYVKEDV